MTQPKKKMQIPPARSLGGALREQLKALLEGGQAHATLEAAVKGLPAKLRGQIADGLPYSAWQLLEHIRIAQRDILDFSRNEDGSYRPQKWPESYWPKGAAPPDAKAWDESVRRTQEDRAVFVKLVDSVDDTALIEPFAWGDGQNLLHEAFLIADHEAYHVGEMIVLRRLLGAWKG